jgi:hypothetical protein
MSKEEKQPKKDEISFVSTYNHASELGSKYSSRGGSDNLFRV